MEWPDQAGRTRADGFGQRGLLHGEQHADLAADCIGGDGDDVVAADDAVLIEPVGGSDRDFGGQAADGRGDRCHRHPTEVGSRA